MGKQTPEEKAAAELKRQLNTWQQCIKEYEHDIEEVDAEIRKYDICCGVLEQMILDRDYEDRSSVNHTLFLVSEKWRKATRRRDEYVQKKTKLEREYEEKAAQQV